MDVLDPNFSFSDIPQTADGFHDALRSIVDAVREVHALAQTSADKVDHLKSRLVSIEREVASGAVDGRRGRNSPERGSRAGIHGGNAGALGADASADSDSVLRKIHALEGDVARVATAVDDLNGWTRAVVKDLRSSTGDGLARAAEDLKGVLREGNAHSAETAALRQDVEDAHAHIADLQQANALHASALRELAAASERAAADATETATIALALLDVDAAAAADAVGGSVLERLALLQETPIISTLTTEVRTLRAVVQSIRGGGTAFIGVEVQPFGKKGGGAGGCYVGDTVPNGPASVAGLQRDDRVRYFGTHPVNTCRDFEDALLHCFPGEVVAIVVERERASRPIEFLVTLGESQRRATSRKRAGSEPAVGREGSVPPARGGGTSMNVRPTNPRLHAVNRYRDARRGAAMRAHDG